MSSEVLSQHHVELINNGISTCASVLARTHDLNALDTRVRLSVLGPLHFSMTQTPCTVGLRKQARTVYAWSAASEARLRPDQAVDSNPPDKRSDFIEASDEFQRLCKYQLRLVSDVFASKGELVASIYMRLPGVSRMLLDSRGALANLIRGREASHNSLSAPLSHTPRLLSPACAPGSLRNGSLELQRICWTPQENVAGVASHAAILIGGKGSDLTEERVTAQTTFSLPGRGHVVFPLVSSFFLVGLIVVEGFNVPPPPACNPPADTSDALDDTAPPQLPRVLPPPSRATGRPHQAPPAVSPHTADSQAAPADHFVRPGPPAISLFIRCQPLSSYPCVMGPPQPCPLPCAHACEAWAQRARLGRDAPQTVSGALAARSCMPTGAPCRFVQRTRWPSRTRCDCCC